MTLIQISRKIQQYHHAAAQCNLSEMSQTPITSLNLRFQHRYAFVAPAELFPTQLFIDQTLAWCRASVVNGWPTLNQHLFNVLSSSSKSIFPDPNGNEYLGNVFFCSHFMRVHMG